jgi:radical SAM superfamily enzyme YgiQ (UPF0313 family)
MKLKTALLINPWIYDFAAYDLWAKPLGLLYLASQLRRYGIGVKLWDAMSRLPLPERGNSSAKPKHGTGKYYRTPVSKPEPLKHVPRTYARYGAGPEWFIHDLKETDPPDAVFITSLMTYWYPGVFEAVRTVKTVFPGVPVILGGIYATLCTDHARLHSGADYVICGEAEQTLPGLLNEISMESEGLCEYKAQPYPAFDLVPRLDYVCIMSSRGCPYTCHYCASRMLTPSFTERPWQEVFEEIVYWHTTRGVRDFAFYDDALLVGSEGRIIPLLEEVIRQELDLRFHTPNGLHLREITKEAALILRKAGFATIRLGYESADMAWHRQTGGKVRPGDLEQALHNLWRAGFSKEQVGVYILVGLPGQGVSEVEEAIGEVMALSARAYLAEYSPIPGTVLWPKAVECSSYDLENEPLFHNNTLLPCASDEFTPDILSRLKRLRD